MRTQVAIIGAGPAGLLLAHLLHLCGVESVVIERSARSDVETRTRAGHLEPATVDILMRAKVGGRLAAQGLNHSGVLFHYNGNTRRLDLQDLTNRKVTIFGQHEICKDLIVTRVDYDGPIFFESSEIELSGINDKPSVIFWNGGKRHSLRCDFIAGCDGFHGICRKAMPDTSSIFEHKYPFSWLGILAQARPVASELIYAPHDRGLAVFSMRSQEVARYYLQVPQVEKLENWPDRLIWDELCHRLGGREDDVERGNILEKRIFPLRAFVIEPMQWGKLFLVGDAAHIVPPSAAKGLNMAVADAHALAGAFQQYYAQNDGGGLEAYSEHAKGRIWEGQRFSQWMTKLLHHDSRAIDFDRRTQLAELDRLFGVEHAARDFAEAYVGSQKHIGTKWQPYQNME